MFQNLRHQGQSPLRTVIFFVVLTMALTGVVIVAWEKIFLRPVYALVEKYYPGEELRAQRSVTQQRIEHFVISVTVDAVVVTILLAVVRRQQKELSDSEEHYRLLFDNNPEPMWIVRTSDQRLVSVNDAALALYGYDRREFLLLTQSDICVPTDASGHPVAGECNDPPSFGVSETHRRKNGTNFAAESNSHTIEFEEQPANLVLVRDLTERNASERALQEMRDQLARNERISALGQAAAQVAHEVKNPLAGLRLYSLHLKSRVEGKLSESETAMIDKIVDGIGRLAVTTEQILSFARPVELKPAAADLNGIVSEVLHVLAPQIEEHQVQVERRFDTRAVEVKVDGAAMQAALLNLILNAVQAMPEGGVLTLTTQSQGAKAFFRVRDTGQGMSPEQVAHVFEPFYTTKSQGLGLGMPYAKKIIEQHSGTIVVNSRPGEGTEIAIELGQ